MYRLVGGYWRLIGTDVWILAPFWLPIRPVFLSLVGRRIDYFGKKYSTMYRRIKSKDSFKIEQNVALPTKIISLRLRIHTSTGRLYLFLLLPTKNAPMAVQSRRLNNKSVGFFAKKLNRSNIFRRPIRGLFGRPDKSF